MRGRVQRGCDGSAMRVRRRVQSECDVRARGECSPSAARVQPECNASGVRVLYKCAYVTGWEGGEGRRRRSRTSMRVRVSPVDPSPFRCLFLTVHKVSFSDRTASAGGRTKCISLSFTPVELERHSLTCVRSEVTNVISGMVYVRKLDGGKGRRGWGRGSGTGKMRKGNYCFGFLLIKENVNVLCPKMIGIEMAELFPPKLTIWSFLHTFSPLVSFNFAISTLIGSEH